jgi:DNA-binding Lrp family transcriptional regulator
MKKSLHLSRSERRMEMERNIVEKLILKKSFNTIARELKVSKKTIRKVFVMATDAGYLSGTPMPLYPEKIFKDEEPKHNDVYKALEEHIEWIRDCRNANWHWITIWENLSEKVDVPRSTFYRFIEDSGLKFEGDYGRLRVIPEIRTEPGETLYLDWGVLCTYIDENNKRQKVYAFTGTLGFSRYIVTEVVLTMDLETTIDALENMFKKLEGTPLKLTTDNAKCISIIASKYEATLNVGFRRFAEHYKIIVECLPPNAPQKKGKVERMVPFVRRLYEAAGDWAGVEKAQKYLDGKIDTANRRKHGTTKLHPATEFVNVEQKELRPLPRKSFYRESYHEGVVRRDGHVYFKGKYYSLAVEYIGKRVFVLGNSEKVKIYHNGELLEVHDRITSSYQSKSTKKHHLRISEQMMLENGPLLERAEKLGIHVKEVIERLLVHGNGYVDRRKVWGILSLDKKYTAEKIDKACSAAIATGETSYLYVKGYLENEEGGLIESERSEEKNYEFAINIQHYKEKVQ